MGQLPHDHALARPLVEPVLWRRDEVCVTHGGGVLVALTLTANRSAWLVEHERVVNAFVASSGRPAPLLAIHRLDKRFPLDVGFDENLPELARTLGRLRGAFSAIAVVLEFDGIMAAAFGVSLDVVTLLAGGRLPPIARHPTPGSALRWLVHERGLTGIEPAEALVAVQRARSALGEAAPPSRL